MTLDLTGPLMASLKNAQNAYRTARDDGDSIRARQKAYECAGILATLGDAVPARRAVYQEKAREWTALARQTESTSRPPAARTTSEKRPGSDSAPSYGEDLITKPPATWDDIGGLDGVKKTLMETVVLAGLQKPRAIQPWNGILLFGPPGTGKTLLAAAAAGSLHATFFNVKTTNMLSKYFGESARLITSLYQTARVHAPSIVFIDECDAVGLSRGDDGSEATRRMVGALLGELDGLQEKKSDTLLLTLGATNVPWDIDPALLSRFSKRIYVPLPDEATCSAIIMRHTDGVDRSRLDVAGIARRCVGRRYSGRDVAAVCQHAVLQMVRRENPDLHTFAALPYAQLKRRRLALGALDNEYFADAFATIKSPISAADVARYERWNRDYGG